ncbi:uncharacterized protein PG998_000006 [Apiospora kogelbergensis]|uniref:uncharacterized protein n=1 Tax=Apiospora kogelbergensis TaxID=1337665 RepID=UPI00312DF009
MLICVVGCLALGASLCQATVAPRNSSDNVYATYHNNVEDLLDSQDGIPVHPVDYQASGKLATAVDQDGNGLEQVEAHLSYYEDFYLPPELTITPTKPVVRYSNATNQYVMLLGNQQLTDLAYLVSKSPAGPFSGPSSAAPGVLSGANIGHDFDIALGPDGTYWLLTDTMGKATLPIDGSGKYPTTVGITWDVVVQKLNPDLTSVPAPSDATFRLVRSATELAALDLSLEACSFFYHDGYYYMIFGQTCQNCAGFIYYLYSKDNPLGPYTDGGFLRTDGCGAQNKGTSVLPTAHGEVVVGAALAYRSSPTSVTLNGLVGHANNNQALSQTFYYPLEFNADHTIKPWTCPAKVQIPLAANVTEQPHEPPQYQLDCRVRNWQSIEVVFDPPRDASNISFPVYQRNDDVSPAFTPAIIDGPLEITLQYDDASSSSHVFRPLDVSWAPSKINIAPQKSKVGKIRMSTNATTGCFGYIVQPKASDDLSLASVDTYGNRRETPTAQVYFYSF